MTAPTLDELVERINETYELGIDRRNLLGFFSKKLTTSSSIAVERAGHGYHIEVTGANGAMLVFPVVTSSAYEDNPTAHPEEKSRYVLLLDLTLYRRNLLALAERLVEDAPVTPRWSKEDYEQLADRLRREPSEKLPATTECRFAVRRTGQRQTEIGSSDDGADFIALRKCLLPGDYLIFLQTGPGQYDVVGMPAEAMGGREWEGSAVGDPGLEVRGAAVRHDERLEVPAVDDDYGTETERMITRVVDTCRLFGNRAIVALAGVPGTGKSYIAAKAAQRLAGSDERVREVQFHPSYSYEEFVEGLRLSGSGAVDPKPGVLLEWNQRALDNPAETYVVLIEELTRADIAAVLGELMTYIEHRDRYFLTLYDRRRVAIAPNLVVLATYNPADRSAIDVDDALLRRLRIIEFPPSVGQLAEMLSGSDLGPEALRRLQAMFEACQDEAHGDQRHFMPFGHGIFAGVTQEYPDLHQLWIERIQHMLWRPLVTPNPFADLISKHYPWQAREFRTGTTHEAGAPGVEGGGAPQADAAAGVAPAESSPPVPTTGLSEPGDEAGRAIADSDDASAAVHGDS